MHITVQITKYKIMSISTPFERAFVKRIRPTNDFLHEFFLVEIKWIDRVSTRNPIPVFSKQNGLCKFPSSLTNKKGSIIGKQLFCFLFVVVDRHFHLLTLAHTEYNASTLFQHLLVMTVITKLEEKSNEAVKEAAAVTSLAAAAAAASKKKANMHVYPKQLQTATFRQYFPSICPFR